jgi:hypothetical protein
MIRLTCVLALLVSGLAACSSSPKSGHSNPASRQPAGAYTNSPGYQDEEPFANDEPAIDGLYDSGYDESLYSPFSFN